MRLVCPFVRRLTLRNPGRRAEGRHAASGSIRAMLEGLMQHDHPLTLQHVLWRMRTMNADGEVVTLTEDGATRATYGELAERIDRLCNALTELGVGPGDRVATFAWNSQ